MHVVTAEISLLNTAQDLQLQYSVLEGKLKKMVFNSAASGPVSSVAERWEGRAAWSLCVQWGRVGRSGTPSSPRSLEGPRNSHCSSCLHSWEQQELGVLSRSPALCSSTSGVLQDSPVVLSPSVPDGRMKEQSLWPETWLGAERASVAFGVI